VLCGLAGDAEPGADLSPGVAAAAQALDRLGYGGVQLIYEADHEDQRIRIAVPDAPAVGAQDKPDERGELVVLDLLRGASSLLSPGLRLCVVVGELP
jgi:hypothetical protein